MEKSRYAYFAIGVFLIVYIICPHRTTKDWHNVVRQPNSYSCGYSCLKMIFNHYGIIDDSANMQKKIIQKSVGTTFLDLKSYATAKGLCVRAWKQSVGYPSTKNTPSILLINDSHFIVLDSIKNDLFYIRDPLKGNIILREHEFSSIWNRYILTFTR